MLGIEQQDGVLRHDADDHIMPIGAHVKRSPRKKQRQKSTEAG